MMICYNLIASKIQLLDNCSKDIIETTNRLVSKINKFSLEALTKIATTRFRYTEALQFLSKDHLSTQKILFNLFVSGIVSYKTPRTIDLSELKTWYSQDFLGENSATELSYTAIIELLLRKDYGLLIQGHTGNVNHMALTNNNNQIISASSDTTLRLWNFRENHQEALLEGHTGSILSVIVSSDSKYIISGSTDCTVRLWSIHKKTLEAILQGHTSSVRCLAITNDSKHIASGSDDTSVRI